MKSLLYLSLIGAAIYAALLLLNPLPDSDTDAVAVQAQGVTPAAGQRSSWASDLSTLKPQIAAQERPHLRYYERKPRPKLSTRDEEAVADSSSEAKSVAAPPKPKVASRKAKWRAGSAQAELSDRVAVKKSDYKRPRWQRRAERRARKSFGRAFLLGR